MDLKAGTVLHNGKYVIHSQLGKGVFSITYLAINAESGQTVVVKTLSDNLCHHPHGEQFKRQFIALGRLLSGCQHQHLVRVIEAFEAAGRPYLVMEYIPGQTLAELIQANLVPEAQAIAYIRQIGDALSVLHQKGLLHLDVRPENIILRQDTDKLVLCEFGITSQLTLGVRQTHASLIAAGYSAPEQYVSKGQLSQATDVYSLTATFYCLLTGTPPLPAPVREVLHAQEGFYILFLPDLPPCPQNLTPVVKQAVWRGLHMVTNQRPQTVEAWLSLLPTQEKVPQSSSQLKVLSPQQKSLISPKLSTNPSRLSTNPSRLSIQTSNISTNSSKRSTNPSKRSANPSRLSTDPSKLSTQTLAVLKTVHAKLKTQTSKLKTTKAGFPVKALLMTGALAASAGLGFGFALRINSQKEPGSTIFHTDQSFPPRSNWPLSEPQL
ncbi:serine/threonine-protein kinase [Moorena sp. SIO3H5]|uniref:serine/threonine protein kinase n=1 Tax=Moorena sp. SIO3H5 TaxID=2607834 RepID=UPI0013BB0DEB|nr:serine/threonine-protein kinase [Moorena sp. SIO3H5]NEO70432.1 protein kinase [Moorena sp. SIO3H5]